MQRSHLPARPGDGARGAHRRSIPTYRQGRCWRPGQPSVQCSHLRQHVTWSRCSRWPTAQHSHLPARPGDGAQRGHRRSIPTYRHGRQLAPQGAIGAASPPTGRAGSRCPARPSAQRSHLSAGPVLAPRAAIGAAFPPIGKAENRRPGRPAVQRSHLLTRPGDGARGGHRYSVPTYRHGQETVLEAAIGAVFPPVSRAGCWRPGRPAVQRSHLRQHDLEPALEVAIGAASPPTGTAGSWRPGRPAVQRSHLSAGPGVSAHRTFTDDGSDRAFTCGWRSSQLLPRQARCRRPAVQRSHLSARPGAGAQGGLRRSVPTYQQGRVPVPRAVFGAAFPPIGKAGAGARGGHRCSVPTCRHGQETVLEVPIGAASPPIGRAGAGARGSHRCSVPTYASM
ncbi:hypothetical protein ACPF7Z_08370 [Halomonas sp. GXIMD04776]|uniref:hypothetical protein n=1 Tax=Halomonas sp. GXIMD04776 TaxID=3415605 RepID=UPI003C99B39C